MTVATIFGDTVDGFLTSTNATYATAQAGSGLVADTAGTTFNNGDTTGFNLYEGFLSWSLATIAAGSTVTNSEIDLWLVTDNSLTDFTTLIEAFDWGVSLTTADWQTAGVGSSLDGLHNGMTFLSSSGIGATGAYKVFPSTATFNAAVTAQLGGNFRVIVYGDQMVLNAAPTQNRYMVWSSADNTGTTQDPKLIVTYTPPTGSTDRHFPRGIERGLARGVI